MSEDHHPYMVAPAYMSSLFNRVEYEAREANEGGVLEVRRMNSQGPVTK
jgi:hypothetical protein